MNERDKLIEKLIAEKGGSRKDYLNLLDSIAYHESAHTLDPKIKQKGGGPGRGKYQFEAGKHAGGITAAKRTKKYYTDNKIPVPTWLEKAASGNDLDATTLTGEQQDILFLANMRKHPKADFKNVWDGKETVSDFWLNYHWAGPKKDRASRKKAWQESMDLKNGIQRDKFVPPFTPQESGGSLDTDPKKILKDWNKARKKGEAPTEQVGMYLDENSKQYKEWKEQDEIYGGGNYTFLDDYIYNKITPRGNSNNVNKLREVKRSLKESLGVRGKNRYIETPEREEMWKYALGSNEKMKLFEKSKYTPTKKTDDNKLYLTPKNWNKQRFINEALTQLEKENKDLTISNQYIPNLNHGRTDYTGNYTISKGEDEKGKYVSFYDKWDLANPLANWFLDRKPETYGRAYYKDNPIYNELIDLEKTKDSLWNTRTKENMSKALDMYPDRSKLIRKAVSEGIRHTDKYIENTKKAMGGKLPPSIYNNIFNAFNTGGLHETNRYGGIPVGMGSNGKMNTVEEGEASFNFEDGKYIFSNRLS